MKDAHSPIVSSASYAGLSLETWNVSFISKRNTMRKNFMMM